MWRSKIRGWYIIRSMDAQGLLSSMLAGRPAVQGALQACSAEDWPALLTLAGRLGVLLLLCRNLIQAGIAVLRAAGFAPYQDFSAEVELPLAKHLPPFQKNGTVIELHWDVTAPESPVRVDLDGLWRRAVPFENGNSRALALCPEDLLLHLCIHAAHHYFYDQLRSLCDVREGSWAVSAGQAFAPCGRRSNGGAG